MASDDPAGIVRSKCSSTGAPAPAPAGYAKRDVAKTNLARGRRVRRAIAGAQRAGGTHRRLEPQHRGDRGSRSVERPTESAERDHRHADGALHVDDGFPETDAAVGGGARQQPEHHDVRGDDEEHAPDDRTLAQTRRCVLQLVQAGAPGDEAVDRPAGEAEQPQFLARGRIHRQPVGVVGIPLRAAHFLGVAVAPDRALAQQPVRRQPRAREHDRRPPRVPGEDHGGGDAADHLDHAAGDEIHGDRQRRAGHPEVEVARDGEVAGERRILEVPHARRAHAGLGEPVVEPRGSAVAEVGADRLMNRAEHLKQHEDRRRQTRADRREDRRAARRRPARPWRSRTTAGRIPRSRRAVHQAAARPGSAFGRTPKNFHSLRSVSALEHDRILPQNPARAQVPRPRPEQS